MTHASHIGMNYERLRAAFASLDLSLLEPLLTDGVQFASCVGRPRRCCRFGTLPGRSSTDDADSSYAEWRSARVSGQFFEPQDTDYGLREGAHVDMDGNLIRFGSPLPVRESDNGTTERSKTVTR